MSGPFGAGGLNFFSGETVFYPYLLKRSLRFNDDGSTGATGTASRLRFQPTSTGSNTDWTISFWVKRNTIGTLQDIIDVGVGDGTGSSGSSDPNTDSIQFQTDDTMRIQRDGSAIVETLFKFRDTSSWYNIVVKSDADNGTTAEKLKVYVNGVDQDDSASGAGFSPDNRSGLSNWSEIGSTDPIQIGARIYNNGNNLDAYLAEFHYVDGTALTASSFGETKEGVWIPKDYTGTHGTNGFYLNFTDDSTVAGFSAVTYTGPIPNAAAQGTTGTVSGVGFQPDFVWIKNRTNANNHQLFDVVRGIDSSGDQALHSNLQDAQSTANLNGGLSSIDADGFTLKAGTDGGSNPANTTRSILVGGDNHNYVSWNWQAGGAPTTDNSAGQGNVPTAGSVKINGSNSSSALSGSLVAKKISANTTYGFSIVKWTGVGGGAATIDHGLGVAPKFIIVKHINNATYNWNCFHQGIDSSAPEDFFIPLDTDQARQVLSSADCWNRTVPTNTVFSVNSVATAGLNGEDMLAYCFSEISGYSSIGSYTGNGSTGQTITTGFKVGWLIVKRTDAVNSWYIVDNTRTPNTAAGNDDLLFANLPNVEGSTNDFFTLTSTGFTLNTGSPAVNTNGGSYIYMAFKDTRTNAFYFDQSGNGNHPSATGLEYTDSKPDLPTNNFPTWMPNYKDASDINTVTLTDGNLKVAGTSSLFDIAALSFALPKSGKWYFEYTIGGQFDGWGFVKATDELSITGGNGLGNLSTSQGGGIQQQGWRNGASVTTNFGSTFTAGEIHQVALDVDGGKLYYGINNTYYAADGGSDGNPSSGTNHLSTFDFAGNDIKLMTGVTTDSVAQNWNFGQNGTFNNTKVAQGNSDKNGIGDFFYAPPSDFLALCTDNLPDPEIDPNAGDNPEDYFNSVKYLGNNTSPRAITGVGFEPDWVWIKDRTAANNHVLVDRVRGVSELLYTNSSVAAVTGASQISSFDSDGFTLGATTYVNENSSSNAYVAWNWKAGGTAVSNTDGDVTSSISANTESGFSIVTYTTTGVGDITVGHGLGKAPEMIFGKVRGENYGWNVFALPAGATQGGSFLNSGNGGPTAFGSDTAFGATAPTTTVFTAGRGGQQNMNFEAGNNVVAYCFASVDGFSKIGAFVGNSSTDGTYVYTGFRPAFLIIKNIQTTDNWFMFDSVRSPYNEVNGFLRPNTDGNEFAFGNGGIDVLANGFKLRGDSTLGNGHNQVHIYLAFAKQPFKYANAG